tara:strand:+ start:3946 stop:4479 length:534 start_codon:yes stop_codon:yes gene_type:complete
MPEEDIQELKKELRKLKPQARIKKLKELEKTRKGEINKIEELIKDSEKDLKTEAVAEEVAPEQTDVNIERLFGEEENVLENTVKKESPDSGEGDNLYRSFKQATDDYSALKDISYATMMGPITSTQMDAIDQIGERLDQTKYHSASQEVADVLVASRSTLHKIKKYASLDKSGNQNF